VARALWDRLALNYTPLMSSVNAKRDSGIARWLERYGFVGELGG